MLVLVILAAIWAAVLVPPYLQNRRETRPGDSIASFRSQLLVLERTTPGGRSGHLNRFDAARHDPNRHGARRAAPSAAAMRRAEIRRRRRDVFLTLLGAVGVTFVLALALGGAVWMLHLLVDIAFGAYVLLLISLQQQSVEREEKVRYLAPTRPVVRPDQQVLLRRSGG